MRLIPDSAYSHSCCYCSTRVEQIREPVTRELFVPVSVTVNSRIDERLTVDLPVCEQCRQKNNAQAKGSSLILLAFVILFVAASALIPALIPLTRHTPGSYIISAFFGFLSACLICGTILLAGRYEISENGFERTADNELTSELGRHGCCSGYKYSLKCLSFRTGWKPSSCPREILVRIAARNRYVLEE